MVANLLSAKANYVYRKYRSCARLFEFVQETAHAGDSTHVWHTLFAISIQVLERALVDFDADCAHVQAFPSTLRESKIENVQQLTMR